MTSTHEPRRPSALAGAGVWAALIVASRVFGAGRDYRLGTAAPLIGHIRLRTTFGLAPAIAVAVAVVAAGPVLARRLRFTHLALAAWASSLAWTLALALSAGVRGLTQPLRSPFEYFEDLDRIASPVPFLAAFVDRLPTYHVHTRGHPPGFLLLLWTLDRIGLRGAAVASVLVVVAGTSAVVAVLLAVRALAGEDAARRAAPFLVLMPGAVWVATSADALYMGAAAWGVALFALACTAGRLSDGAAVIAGVVLGAALFMTYGAVLVAVPVLAVALATRRARPLVAGAAGVGLVVAAFAAAGFWWPDGLAGTEIEYRESVARVRPYSYFVLGNLGAFALATGPAAAAGLAALRDRRVWWVCGAWLAAVLLADVSGMSKGEVERIWLPFAPWVIVAAVSLSRPRAWLAAAAAVGLAVQAFVVTPW